MDANELLLRSVFDARQAEPPDKVKFSAFKNKAGIDEVSVDRRSMTTYTETKRRAKTGSRSTKYCGIASVCLCAFQNNGFNVYSGFKQDYDGTLLQANQAHAWIELGIVLEPGQELPDRLKSRLMNALKNSHFLMEPEPENPQYTCIEFSTCDEKTNTPIP
jgi:hypothetical protein